MRAHTPPFTKSTAKQVYDETSAIAAAQDAKLDPISDVESKVRTAMQYLYHAQLLLKEAFPYTSGERVKKSPKSVHVNTPNADIPEKSPLAGELDIDWNACFPTRAQLAEQGTSAEVAYLRKCGIGDVAETATTVASQHPMAAEVLRDHDERLNGPEDHL